MLVACLQRHVLADGRAGIQHKQSSMNDPFQRMAFVPRLPQPATAAQVKVVVVPIRAVWLKLNLALLHPRARLPVIESIAGFRAFHALLLDQVTKLHLPGEERCAKSYWSIRSSFVVLCPPSHTIAHQIPLFDVPPHTSSFCSPISSIRGLARHLIMDHCPLHFVITAISMGVPMRPSTISLR